MRSVIRICAHCGAHNRVTAKKCSRCKHPFPDPIGRRRPTIDEPQRAVPYRPTSRRHEIALSALPWIIAVLPAILLEVTMLLGLWPNTIAILVQIAIIIAVVALDARMLLRAGAATSIKPLFGTPAYYLYRRAWRTGREWATVWVGSAVVLVWLGAGAWAFNEQANRTIHDTDQEVYAVVTPVSHQLDHVLTAWTDFHRDSDPQSLADLQSAAGRLDVALSELGELWDFGRFTADEQEAADAVAESIDELRMTASDLESVSTPAELGSAWCDFHQTGGTFIDAMADYLEAADHTWAPEWRDVSDTWQQPLDDCDA